MVLANIRPAQRRNPATQWRPINKIRFVSLILKEEVNVVCLFFFCKFPFLYVLIILLKETADVAVIVCRYWWLLKNGDGSTWLHAGWRWLTFNTSYIYFLVRVCFWFFFFDLFILYGKSVFGFFFCDLLYCYSGTNLFI